MPDRREQLRQWYGLDFPDDLFDMPTEDAKASATITS